MALVRPLVLMAPLLLARLSSAQNLVPNPGFEAITSCPTFASMLGNAAPWTNPTAGTPELFHACAPSGDYAGVPRNYSNGFQWPRTGDGYAGIFVYRTGISEMREYIMAPLLEPLEAGVCYSFSMYVNAANDHELVCDGVGAHFSVGPVVSGSASALPLEPHIDHPQGTLINDTLGWTLVSGSYVATGGEDHVVIGNFRNDANTLSTMYNPGSWYAQTAYLLIDDVSLVRSELAELDLGPDTVLCEGASLELDATIPGATSTLWSDGITTPIRGVTTTGIYSVTVQVGACSASDEILIQAAPLPTVDLGADRTICAGLHEVILAHAVGHDQLVWDDGSTSIERTVEAPGVYAITASNACGSVTDQVRVDLEDCPEGIYLPNAFTPDGDGLNDAFAPVFDARLWAVSFSIYDRWGRMIHNSPVGQAWKAEEVPLGVYITHLKAQHMVNGSAHHERHGHVSILR